jgi:hypothetical protein
MLRKAANIIFLLGLIPWAFFFLISFMLFDAPGSESSPLTIDLFFAIAVYPVLVIIGFFSSSGFWRLKDEHHWRRHLAFLPLASPVAVVVFLMAIDAHCGGSCHATRSCQHPTSRVDAVVSVVRWRELNRAASFWFRIRDGLTHP